MNKSAGILFAILVLALAATSAQEKTGARPGDTSDDALVAN